MNGFREVFNVDSVYKLDVTTGEPICRKETGFVPSEGIFVPHPQAEAEDEGVLLHQWMSLLPDAKPKLMILDAKDLHLIAELEFPVNLPVGIHGMVFQELEGEEEEEEKEEEEPNDEDSGFKTIISIFMFISVLLL